MATKKQKRLAGEKKQAANLEMTRASGLAAQKRDRERRERQKQDAEREYRRRATREAIDIVFGSTPPSGG